MTIQQLRAWSLAVLIAAGGCADDPSQPPTEDTETTAETGGAPDCDPQGAVPEVGALLNAPLEADVEVIRKTPQHPGPVGPVGLP